MKYVPPYGVTANPDASYVNGDPSIGRQGSIPPAAVFENPQREIVNLITDSQQVASDTDLHQLTRAVRDGKLHFCVDSGPINQLQVNLFGPPIQAYTAGLTLRVLVGHTNTAGVNISVGTLNPTTVKRRDGSQLQPGDILAGMIATLACDGTFFQLQNMGVGSGGGGDTTIQEIDIPYVHDTGTANHLIGAYSPPLVDLREGRTVEIKLLHNVTGPTDFTPNNFPTRPVAHPDGSPIKAGDGVINQIWLLCYDGVQWQLIGAAAAAAAPLSIGSGKSLTFNYVPGNNTSSYLIRSPAQNSNRQVWTWSMFFKRTNITPAIQPYINQCWISSGGAQLNSDFGGMYFDSYGPTNMFTLWWNDSEHPVAANYLGVGFTKPANVGNLNWHHFLEVADGAYLSCYIDGELVSQGAISGNGSMNSTRPHCIGTDADDLYSTYGAAVKMAEMYFVDGLALTWQSFANNIGGIMIPKLYTGPFGVNGCYLNWSDSSAATAATLGKDWSGNGNNWLPYNISTSQISTDYPG